jgi:hypothetical protein
VSHVREAKAEAQGFMYTTDTEVNTLRHSGTVHFAVTVFKDVTKKGLATTALLLDQVFTGAPHDVSLAVGTQRCI